MSSIQTLILAPGVEIVPGDDDPLVAHRSSVSREMLREGIRQLSNLERDALRLATREGLSVHDSAAQLGIEADDVLASLRSGLHVLRQSLLTQLEEGRS